MGLNEVYGPGGFDPTKPNNNVVAAEQVEDDPRIANELTMRRHIAGALATNRTYVGLASPTAAQTAAQVKALSRQMNSMIRLWTAAFDGAD